MEAHYLPRAGGLLLPRSRRVLGAFGDERLVEQVRRGNEAAFEAIYDRHHRAILSFCRHMLASVEEAEDAVQHTFVAAYDSLRASDRDIKLKPWLFTIARNRCLSILRARREQAAELDDVPTAGLSTQVQRRSDLRDLLDDIRELPEDQRAALVLSELGDLSHAEIAEVVGCEVAKVKSLVFQARSSLIESRKARETPCEEIREQLATLRGGALRRGTIRRHVNSCPGCAEFRDEVRRQRAMLGAILPVVPSVALRHSALAAAGIGGGGGAGAAAGGGFLSAAGAGGAGKAVAVAVAASIAVGGGVAVTEHAIHSSSARHSAPVVTPASPNASPRAHGDTSIFPPASPAARAHSHGLPGAQAPADHGRGRAHRAHGHGQGSLSATHDAAPATPAAPSHSHRSGHAAKPHHTHPAKQHGLSDRVSHRGRHTQHPPAKHDPPPSKPQHQDGPHQSGSGSGSNKPPPPPIPPASVPPIPPPPASTLGDAKQPAP